QIMAVDVPPDPVLIEAEVQRLTNLFNQRESVIITTLYHNNQVTVNGDIKNEKEAQQITQSFVSIPGIKNVFITLKPQPFPIDQRFYFNYDSAEVKTEEIILKIQEISRFLEKYPEMKIKIIGHTDPTGTEVRNKQLSQARAIAIKNILVKQGIDPQRLKMMGFQNPPADVYPDDPLWLGRCVRFERIM
ncbi:MAG TPA: OmpA family protein, partial [Allocoleopsis sp.]